MIVCRFCLFLLSYRIGGGASRGVSRKVRDCRIVSSHGVSRRVTGFSFYHGLSVFFFHTESRGGHELSNYRIITFNHTESRGRSRIIELSSHGMSQKITDFSSH